MGGAGVSKHSSARSSIKVLHCAYSQFLNSDESHHRLSKSIQKAQFKIKNFSQHALKFVLKITTRLHYAIVY